MPTKINLFLDYENLVGYFCPREIITISYGIYVGPQALPEERVIYMSLISVPLVLMLGTTGGARSFLYHFDALIIIPAVSFA